MATDFPIEIDQGADWEMEITWEEDGVLMPLSDYSAKMDIRVVHGGELLASISKGSGITLGDEGQITLAIPASTTQGITRNGYYDLKLTAPAPSNKATRLLQGAVTLKPEVTE